MKVILEMVSGPRKGKTFVFERPEAFVIGRKKNERVQFRIPRDPTLSRYHMLIEVNRGECLLRDLGSTNGTWVNGRRVKTSSLNNGDVLSAGQSKICVRIEKGAAPEPEEGEDPPPSSSPPGADWDTRVFGHRPDHSARRGLDCMKCGEPAADSHLGGLVDTHLLAYVCPECMKKHRDPEQPIPNYHKLKSNPV